MTRRRAPLLGRRGRGVVGGGGPCLRLGPECRRVLHGPKVSRACPDGRHPFAAFRPTVPNPVPSPPPWGRLPFWEGGPGACGALWQDANGVGRGGGGGGDDGTDADGDGAGGAGPSSPR